MTCCCGQFANQTGQTAAQSVGHHITETKQSSWTVLCACLVYFMYLASVSVSGMLIPKCFFALCRFVQEKNTNLCFMIVPQWEPAVDHRNIQLVVNMV